MSTSNDPISSGADPPDGSPARDHELTRTDDQILEYLAAAGADYPALIAANTGQHVTYVERRIEWLADRGLVEAVSGEVVYRSTGAGRDAIGGQ